MLFVNIKSGELMFKQIIDNFAILLAIVAEKEENEAKDLVYKLLKDCLATFGVLPGRSGRR